MVQNNKPKAVHDPFKRKGIFFADFKHLKLYNILPQIDVT